MIIDASNRFKGASRGRDKGAGKEAIEEIGNQALQALFADKHSKIDPLTRRTLARNFAELLKSYGLFYPRYFKSIYTNVAGSYESFRTEFGRLKNPNSRSIPASKITWENYVQLLIKKLLQNGKEVSASYIAHKLTLGTNYHPARKSPGETDKIICSYHILAENFDHEFRLLDDYREISNFIVDRNVDDISRKVGPLDEFEYLCDNYDDSYRDKTVLNIHSQLNDYFNDKYLQEREFSGQCFIDLTRDELDEVTQSLLEIEEDYSKDPADTEEQQRLNFGYMRQVVQSYIELTDFSQNHVPALWCLENLRYYPHCLLGVYVYPEFSETDKCELKEFLKRNSDNKGILDPVVNTLICKKGEYQGEQGHTYLVLFPNKTMGKVEPKILILEGDMTMMAPLNEDVVTWRASDFINTTFPHNGGTENNSLIDLLSDAKRIISTLKETSPNLKNHPVLNKKKETEQQRQSIVDALCNPFSNDNN